FDAHGAVGGSKERPASRKLRAASMRPPLALASRPTTQHTLDFAARSVLDGSGARSTIELVLASRALRHSWEALRQLLAIRLGDAEVHATLASLGEAAVEAGAPSARAHFFRMAWGAIDDAAPRLEGPWWSTRAPITEDYRRRLAKVRTALLARSTESAL